MSERSPPLLLSGYLALSSLLEPFLTARMRSRASGQGAAARQRLGEEAGRSSAGPLLWLHGVSLGESLSLLPLLDELRSLRPSLEILLTSRTESSARMLARRLPEGVRHSYAPLDLPNCLDRFLRAWNPRMLALAESEIWPGLLTKCRARGIPVTLVNARMSARSATRWRRAKSVSRHLLRELAFVEVQDLVTCSRLLELGVAVERVDIVPSLKASAAPPPADPGEVNGFKDALAGRTAWLAASTHLLDEDVAFDAHVRILRRRRDAVLVLVPRHPDRADEIEANAKAKGLRVARRSRGEEASRGVTLYLADTFGELGLWYRVLPVSLIGGSRGIEGGHNPFEPAFLGSAILHGGSVWNFKEIYDRLELAGGAHRIMSASQLSELVLKMLRPDGRASPKARRSAMCAAEVVKPMAGQARRTALRLLDLIDGGSGKAGP